MKTCLDGSAIVYCEGAFNTTYGKTAHGLVRFTRRYNVLAVIDSRYHGQDAGQILDGKPQGVLVLKDLAEALRYAEQKKETATHFVIGLAPDGGVLDQATREYVKEAIRAGLHIDSGLHDFLSEDEEMAALAETFQVTLRDIRKPPPRKELHFFSGTIEQVDALKIALLGTDSGVGKRTTAWLLVNALNHIGIQSAMIGTGQTAWLQGAKYSFTLDSLINDFVAGEIEHAVYSAWREEKPDVIVIEGQGSLMNPAFPGGLEILAAGRPDIVILQHAPARKEYDGFPGYLMHPLPQQIQAIELLSGKPVIAITVNHEDLLPDQFPEVCQHITQETHLPAFDVLLHGAEGLVGIITPFLKGHREDII